MKKETFNKPDFIGIGPPKTGTTWIYRNLQQHPQVCFPLDKEIRYFWEKRYLGNYNMVSRLLSKHWHFLGKKHFYRQQLKKHAADIIKGKLDKSQLRWDLRYFVGKRTNRWYSSLFHDAQVSGDISAKYCELPPSIIYNIKAAFPDLKIIITVRNPIERDWSRAKMNLCMRTNRNADEVPIHEFLHHINDPLQKRSNDYARLIESWRNVFGTERVLVLFYDELQDQPLTYFNQLCKFLGIQKASEDHSEKLKEVVFRGVEGDMPIELKILLTKQHKNSIARLAKLLPKTVYPQLWLED